MHECSLSPDRVMVNLAAGTRLFHILQSVFEVTQPQKKLRFTSLHQNEQKD